MRRPGVGPALGRGPEVFVSIVPAATRTEMTQIVMPGQANALGSVFGGQVMAWMDICAAVSAQRFARSDVVTAAVDSLIFRAPVKQGMVVVLQSMVNWAGRTSMEVGVRVEAEDRYTGAREHTSTCYLTFVSLDANGRPKVLPTLSPASSEDRRRWADAEARRTMRLEAREADRRRARESDK